MTTDSVEIDALVRRASKGDAHAFRWLYEAFAPALYRFALFRVRNPADAEDIVQRVFEKTIEALPRYEQRGLPFRAWLFRVARNAVIDFERTRHDGEDLDMLTFRASDDLGPDDLAEAESQRQELLTAISHLTLEQQEVIAYRFFGGLSPGEIAEIIGKRDGSVRALQFRAIESLRKLLARASAEERVADEQPSTLEAVASVLMPAEFASETIASDEVTER